MRQKIYEGSVVPFNLNLSGIGNLSMADYDFEIYCYCNSSKIVKIEKEKAIEVDENNYMFFVDTNQTGCGQLRFAVKAIIPDERLSELEFQRPDIAEVDSGYDVVKTVVSKYQ